VTLHVELFKLLVIAAQFQLIQFGRRRRKHTTIHQFIIRIECLILIDLFIRVVAVIHPTVDDTRLLHLHAAASSGGWIGGELMWGELFSLVEVAERAGKFSPTKENI
jgi:hypothetical protein